MQTQQEQTVPIGRRILDMYTTVEKDEGGLVVGKVLGFASQGRNQWFSVSLYHPDPIAAGQPDAGEMTIDAADLIGEYSFFSTFADAVRMCNAANDARQAGNADAE